MSICKYVNMGIYGLWPLLKVASIPITLDELEGKRLAIDISLWIHQAQKGFNIEQSSKPHLTLLINRIAKLLFYKIRPVFVFDGENLPRFKKQVLRDRLLKRHLQEINITRDKKRLFEHIAANEHSKSTESSSKYNGYTKKSKISSVNFLDSSTSDSTPIFANEVNSDTSSASTDGCGIYSSKIDAQISKLEEHRELERNELVKRSEIPDDADKFSSFQLHRLLQRNKTNTQLKKLKEDKVRNTVDILQSEGNGIKLIISDKNQNVHILTSKEEGRQSQESPSVTLMHSSYASGNDDSSSSVLNSSDDNSDDFIDVYDPEMLNNDSITSIDEDIVLVDKNNEDNTPCISNAENFKEYERVDNEIDASFPSNMHFKNSSNNLITERDVIYSDCQKLLFILGLPFMESPAEAEAQCVELEKLNLVDGIISDDSDVWLFGAKNVFKNMFNKKTHLEKYSSEDIKLKLGLTRYEFIQLGLLAGGDYSRGLEKVGMVTALELISEFVASNNDASVDSSILQKVLFSLNKIPEWILSKRQEKSVFVESQRRIRLRKIIESNNSDEIIKKFPNVEVIEAYAKPLVDNSTEKFIWRRMDFDALDSFLQINLGITREDIFNKTHGAFQCWDTFITAQTQSYQQKITNFTRTSTSFDDIKINTFLPTKRVKNALNKLKNTQKEKNI